MIKISGTKEWAKHNRNIMTGCQHDCLYCYARAMAVRFKRATPENWSDPVLNEKKFNASCKKKDGRIMYPTTHDIHPNNLNEHLDFLWRNLVNGNSFLIVSKPHIECIGKICETFPSYKSQILFRFSIGSPNNDTLSFWEPGAPPLGERFESLALAHFFGFGTSVSCEPMLDDKIEKLVKILLPYVSDSIWIGKANRLKSTCRAAAGALVDGKINPSLMAKIDELQGWQNDERIKEIYETFKDNTKIKWKESIKEVVGIAGAEKAGLDI